MPRGIPRDLSTKRNILHRLKIARGHLERVISMVEKNDYCIDVLNQSQAIQSALRSTDAKLLEHHLKNCALESMKNGKSEEAISEVLNVFKHK